MIPAALLVCPTTIAPIAPLSVAVAAAPVPEAVVDPDPEVAVESPAAALHSALALVS